MESDSKDTEENKHRFSNFSDLLQPSWVRCPICGCDENDRVILDYGRNFLLPFGFFLWVVLAIFI
jgi:hypothetical protein